MNFKPSFTYFKDIFAISLLSIPSGLAIGAVCALFGRILLKITDIRSAHPLYFIPFLALAGLFIVFIYNKWGKEASRGMDIVFDTAEKREENIPLRLVPLITISTWLTHLFGGSAGREGVAVQIGAAISQNTGRLLRLNQHRDIFTTAGMAAGFSGLFGTPIAGVFFALEVLRAGRIKYKALIPALISACASFISAQTLGLEKFTFPLSLSAEIYGLLFIKLAFLGIVFGIVGGAFAYILTLSKNFFKTHLKNPYMRIGAMSVFLSIVLIFLFNGRYCGLGTNIINMGLEGDKIYPFDWALKFILTIITLSAGFQGGEVTPLFSIGTALGAFISPIINVPAPLGACLGYCAVFSSATNTYIAPIFIGAEVFGFEYMPCFFITCTFSYFFNMNRSIYSLQLND